MSKIARRTFIQLSAVAGAGAFLHTSREAVAQDMPQVDESSPTAQALKYVHDASTVDPADRTKPNAEQTCANCMFIQGADDAEWRPCTLFPNQVVNNNGWCSAWALKS